MSDHHNGHDHDHDHGDGDDHDHAGHSHGPGGHHHHHKPPAGFDGAFALGSALNAGFVMAEVVFGLTAHSVALLADAAHNLGDVLGLLLAWWAAWLGRRHPTPSRTYGYGRSSILASVTNAVVLLGRGRRNHCRGGGRDNNNFFVAAFPGNFDFVNAEHGFINTAIPGPGPTTYFEITGGLTISPALPQGTPLLKSITFRPEVRYDASLNGTTPFGGQGFPNSGLGRPTTCGEFLEFVLRGGSGRIRSVVSSSTSNQLRFGFRPDVAPRIASIRMLRPVPLTTASDSYMQCPGDPIASVATSPPDISHQDGWSVRENLRTCATCASARIWGVIVSGVVVVALLFSPLCSVATYAKDLGSVKVNALVVEPARNTSTDPADSPMAEHSAQCPCHSIPVLPVNAVECRLECTRNAPIWPANADTANPGVEQLPFKPPRI